jgi:hypothetical protein
MHLQRTRGKAIGMRRKITMWNLRSQRLHSSLTVVSIVKLDETFKMYAMGAGKSEWP